MRLSWRLLATILITLCSASALGGPIVLPPPPGAPTQAIAANVPQESPNIGNVWNGLSQSFVASADNTAFGFYVFLDRQVPTTVQYTLYAGEAPTLGALLAKKLVTVESATYQKPEPLLVKFDVSLINGRKYTVAISNPNFAPAPPGQYANANIIYAHTDANLNPYTPGRFYYLGSPYYSIPEFDTSSFFQRDIAFASCNCVELEAQFVDPVPVGGQPSLLSGTDIAQNPALIAISGRKVAGVAADGIARLLIRSPADFVGQSVTFELLNTNGELASRSSEDGSLGTLDNQGVSTSKVTVSSVATDGSNGTPMAFAFYRAPLDFVRTSANDRTAHFREVTVRTSLSQPSRSKEFKVAVIRPPVALVHGLWATSQDLGNLPQINRDRLFYALPINYGAKVKIDDSTPPISSYFLADNLLNSTAPIGSSLGFSYGAEVALGTLRANLENFLLGENPAVLSVAGVQWDIVAHSMGNLVVRQMSTLPTFRRNENSRAGDVHKVISVGGPHLGSPLAASLLESSSGCVRGFVAALANYSFGDCETCVRASDTMLPNQAVYVGSGAIGDLSGEGKSGGAMSPALQRLRELQPIRFPTAYLSGAMGAEMINRLVQERIPEVICPVLGTCPLPINAIQVLRLACPNDPAVKNFKGPAAFIEAMTANNDGVVSVESQLNGNMDYQSEAIIGLLHSPGAGALFNLFGEEPEQTELSSQDMLERVIDLLNTPLSNSSAFLLR